jgi:SAM-dependent methyltransferase
MGNPEIPKLSLEEAEKEGIKIREKAQQIKSEKGEENEPSAVDYEKADQIVNEKEEKIEIPKSKTLEHFWNGVMTGKYEELADSDIEKMIDNVYLSEQPLTQLTDEEISKIKESLRKAIKKHVGGSKLKNLSEKEVLFLPSISDEEAREKKGRVMLKDGRYMIVKINHWLSGEGVHSLEIHNRYGSSEKKMMTRDPHFFITEQETDDPHKTDWNNEIIHVIRSIGGKTLSKKQKIERYSDIKTWRQALYHSFNFESPVGAQGYRDLYKGAEESSAGNYGFTKESFSQLLSEIRERTGRNRLLMLDVGGGLGNACFQAEQLDSNLKATNLTIEEEPAMYPVETVIAPAEAMPASFKEKYDLILSNIAFRYFPYPDIALDNCLKSLSVGGEARLSVSTGREIVDVKDYATRLSKEYKKLKDLSEKGFIELSVDYHGPHDPLEYNNTEDEKYFPDGFVRIIKLKPIED